MMHPGLSGLHRSNGKSRGKAYFSFIKMMNIRYRLEKYGREERFMSRFIVALSYIWTLEQSPRPHELAFAIYTLLLSFSSSI
jgi:hypothetical protein